MHKFINQYEEDNIYTASNSGKKHPLFENNPPLSVSEMYHRSINGIPLSAPIAKSDRVPVNGNFFTDKFDSLDYVIRSAERLTEEERQKQLSENEKLRKEREEFQNWKLEQEKERLSKNNPES